MHQDIIDRLATVDAAPDAVQLNAMVRDLPQPVATRFLQSLTTAYVTFEDSKTAEGFLDLVQKLAAYFEPKMTAITAANQQNKVYFWIKPADPAALPEFVAFESLAEHFTKLPAASGLRAQEIFEALLSMQHHNARAIFDETGQSMQSGNAKTMLAAEAETALSRLQDQNEIKTSAILSRTLFAKKLKKDLTGRGMNHQIKSTDQLFEGNFLGLRLLIQFNKLPEDKKTAPYFWALYQKVLDPSVDVGKAIEYTAHQIAAGELQAQMGPDGRLIVAQDTGNVPMTAKGIAARALRPSTPGIQGLSGSKAPELPGPGSPSGL